ncbi:MAG TPA: hypothetical protein VLR54_02890 [Methanobacteriaceae archaeon]|nr:hypothetical protein [Methanobacteriaceae archaeon]
MLIPSIAVKEGWKCTNTDFSAYGQWYVCTTGDLFLIYLLPLF